MASMESDATNLEKMPERCFNEEMLMGSHEEDDQAPAAAASVFDETIMEMTMESESLPLQSKQPAAQSFLPDSPNLDETAGQCFFSGHASLVQMENEGSNGGDILFHLEEFMGSYEEVDQPPAAASVVDELVMDQPFSPDSAILEPSLRLGQNIVSLPPEEPSVRDELDLINGHLFEESESDIVQIEEERLHSFIDTLLCSNSPLQSMQPTVQPSLLDSPVHEPPLGSGHQRQDNENSPSFSQEEIAGPCFPCNASTTHIEATQPDIPVLPRSLQPLKRPLFQTEDMLESDQLMPKKKKTKTMQSLNPSSPDSEQPELPNLSQPPPQLVPSPQSPPDGNFHLTMWTLLEAAVRAITEEKIQVAQYNLNLLRVSLDQSPVCGTPMHHLAEMMHASLTRRINCEPLPAANIRCAEDLEAARLLYNIFPCFKFCLTAANLAILEATKDQPSIIHIIEFDVQEQVEQLAILIVSIAERHRTKQCGLQNPAPPPVVKITAVCDAGCPINPIRLDGDCRNVKSIGLLLTELAEQVKLPFRFSTTYRQIWELDKSTLGCHTEEALAVKFSFSLSRYTGQTRKNLLYRMKKLKPRVVTLAEKEMNDATASPFIDSFTACFTHNKNLLESIEAAVELGSAEKAKLYAWLEHKASNSISAEGAERLEHCELHAKWRDCMKAAGFKPVELALTVIGPLIQFARRVKTDERFTVQKKMNSCLAFQWMDQTLTVASFWR